MRTPLIFSLFLSISACNLGTRDVETVLPVPEVKASLTSVEYRPARLGAKETIALKQVPILCYHRIREFRPSDSKSMKDYIVPVETFKQQIKMLADSGYQTILPDQLQAYLSTGTGLPEKPVMITFDDSEEEHLTIAAAEMKKYNFKGAFFIMTIALGKPGYMSRDQLKQLSDEGHTIGGHSWDHNNAKKYTQEDWVKQVEKPFKQLEEITGKPVKYFAYPFGLWNEAAIPELKKRGVEAAFQLTAKHDPNDPILTIRRMIVPGEWSSSVLYKRMKSSF